MKIEDILAKNKTKSDDANYDSYSPLQCAIYDSKLDEVQALLDYYGKEGALEKELNFVSPADKTKENILQVAMKHPEILVLCC